MLCPKCSREINYLISDTAGVLIQYLSLDKQGDVEYNYKEFEDEEDSIYYCPKCGKTLFNREEEAIAFLKGKEEE